MPRREINNPTRRILRLLDDIDQLESAYEEAVAACAAAGLLERLAPRPALIAVAEERTRQHLMGRKVESNRKSMTRHRLRREVEPRASGLTQEQEAAVRREAEDVLSGLDINLEVKP
jgi:hypothetical protein